MVFVVVLVFFGKIGGWVNTFVIPLYWLLRRLRGIHLLRGRGLVPNSERYRTYMEVWIFHSWYLRNWMAGRCSLKCGVLASGDCGYGGKQNAGWEVQYSPGEELSSIPELYKWSLCQGEGLLHEEWKRGAGKTVSSRVCSSLICMIDGHDWHLNDTGLPRSRVLTQWYKSWLVEMGKYTNANTLKSKSSQQVVTARKRIFTWCVA